MTKNQMHDWTPNKWKKNIESSPPICQILLSYVVVFNVSLDLKCFISQPSCDPTQVISSFSDQQLMAGCSTVMWCAGLPSACGACGYVCSGVLCLIRYSNVVCGV